MDCLFCKIVSGDIKSDIVYKDDDVVAFKDISPQAPFHILIVPKRHIATLNDLTDDDIYLAGKIVFVAKRLAKDLGVEKNGYRFVFNCNSDAGQAVFHIHGHLLAGRRFNWPPG